MHKNLIIGLAAIVLLFAVAYVTYEVAEAPSSDPDGDAGEVEAAAEAFRRELVERAVATVGQPIEGFEPSMLMDAFPGLVREDFDGVEAEIGTYVVVDGELQHELGDEPIHSAAQAISNDGYTKLLLNVAERLEVEPTINGVEIVLAALDPEERATLPPDEEANDEEGVACTMDAKQCPDGSYVGRVPPTCEFAACPGEEAGNDTATVVCTEEMKQAEVCTMEYAPVCGLVEVQCVTEPCDPVPETFSNGCVACSQGNVVSYTPGECTL